MRWIGEDVHSKRWDAVQSSTPHPARLCTASPQRFKRKPARQQHGPRVTSRHSHSLTPSNAPAQPQSGNTIACCLTALTCLYGHMHGPCTCSTINVSGCPANLSVDKEDAHDALHDHGRPSSRRLRVVGCHRRRCCHCGRVCPSAARADHPHGEHRARRPSSAGTHLPIHC